MSYKPQPLYLHSPTFITPAIAHAEVDFLNSWLDYHQPPNDSQLYHYTTLEGLHGILNQRALWLGHISCLNDRTEIQHGEQIVGDILSDATLKEESEDIRIFIQDLASWIRLFGGQNLHHAFVGSFCKSGNLLSQWRSYSLQGHGYCIGLRFSEKTLVGSDASKLDEANPPFLRKVVYTKRAQIGFVQDYLAAMIKAAKTALDEDQLPSDTPRNTGINIMAIQSASRLMDMILSFKHPAFESEEEWRLVRVTRQDFDTNTLKFRETNGQLVPYRPTHIFDKLDNSLLKFPVGSIGLGPALEPGRTKSTLSLLLHHLSGNGHLITLDPGIHIYEAGFSLRT